MSSASLRSDVAAAYQHCEQLTRQQARNFSYGIRLLPPTKRRALSAVYATARRIDDIGDGTLAPHQKLTALADARKALHGLDNAADNAPVGLQDFDGLEGKVLVALRDAATTHPIPLAAFDELIDGCEADVRGQSYPTFDELLHYCRCVAGSVGRLSLGVFDAAERELAEQLADTLGVALQLTNILRDIREDYAHGRVYLPAEDLDRFGCTTVAWADGPGQLLADRFEALIRFEAERAETWYERGLRLLPLLDRRSAACTAAMAGIYHRLLARIRADPIAVLRGRVRLSGWQKARVAAVALAGGVP